MYGSRKCLKGSYFAQLYLKVYLASENECCRCCNTFPEVYNYRGTMLDCAPKMMPVPPPYCHLLSRLPTLNFRKTWSQAKKQSYSFCTAITFLSALRLLFLDPLYAVLDMCSPAERRQAASMGRHCGVVWLAQCFGQPAMMTLLVFQVGLHHQLKIYSQRQTQPQTHVSCAVSTRRILLSRGRMFRFSLLSVRPFQLAL